MSNPDTSVSLSEEQLCPPPAAGPLDPWRRRASFSIARLRLLTHRPELLDVKMRVWRLMEKEPMFSRRGEELSLQQYRDITARRLHRFMELNPLPDSEVMESPLKMMALVSALGMYDWSLCAKKMLLREFFLSSLSGAGTERHRELQKKAGSNLITGCFCLTEISHGTNTKGLGTTATYCRDRKKFILHSPEFASAKCWAGNLAKTATHASVFAQLYTPDGCCHGLHNFVVPIRNPTTLEPYPGVIIGDMGAKIGLNGVDNGWMMFDHYEIDRDMLLNKTGDVTEEGEYVTPFRDPNKRFGASLGNLSGGRVGIINMANTNLHMALIIAVRYSATRKQFGPEGEPEWPVLLYQTQYRRLMPYLAACFALHYFSLTFFEDFVRLLAGRLTGEDPSLLADLGMEVHGMSSAGKPLASWTAQRAIQEAREACGGHGYLTVSRLGSLRDDNDANCTYEGDNNVLLQQTSNWILQVVKKGGSTPAGSLSWLQEYLGQSSVSDKAFTSRSALHVLRILIIKLIKATELELQKLKAEGLDKFRARGSTQFHLARSLSIVFIQSVVVQRFCEYAEGQPDFPILTHLSDLYALWVLEELSADLLVHDVISGEQVAAVRQQVLDLSRDLVPDSVALTDVLAPPDFILNSALGHSSGNVYQLLQQSFMETPGGFSRADFWDLYTEKARAKL